MKMAYNTRRVIVSGAVGLLIATSIILAVQFMPFMPVAEAKSLLVIKVKDAPARLDELFLQIDGVRVHKAGEGEGIWIDVKVVATSPFDLMKLTEVATVLATEELPVGSYTEIRLHVTEANATIDGVSDIPLAIKPQTGWFMVKIHFTLEELGVTTIVMDIDVNETPIVNAKILSPAVKATVEKIGASMPVQNHYRWADNAEPLTWKADQDDPIIDIAPTGAVLRMRLSIKNEGTAIWSGAQLKLQYTTDDPDDPEADWYDVDAQGEAGMWRYHDGLGTDKATVANLFLAGSTVMEHFVESSPTETIANIPIGGQGEWDICIESNGAGAGETYYFRFVLSDGTPLDTYTEYPTLTIAIPPP